MTLSAGTQLGPYRITSLLGMSVLVAAVVEIQTDIVLLDGLLG